jgi:hypothetical protein
MATTWLYRYSDSKPAAWTPDEVHYYAAGSGSYLAWRSDNWLYQVNGGSGTWLVRRRHRVRPGREAAVLRPLTHTTLPGATVNATVSSHTPRPVVQGASGAIPTQSSVAAGRPWFSAVATTAGPRPNAASGPRRRRRVMAATRSHGHQRGDPLTATGDKPVTVDRRGRSTSQALPCGIVSRTPQRQIPGATSERAARRCRGADGRRR